jgi:hypothetical protein
MAKSYQQTTSNGTTNSFPWSDIDGYLQLSHIKVYVNGTLQSSTAYTIDAATRTVAFVPSAPSSGSVVRVVRETPSTVAGRVVDFTDGSVLTATDLDSASLQNLFLTQEAADKGGDAFQKNATDTAWLGQSIRISQVAAPTAGTDVAIKDYVDALALAGGFGGAPVADPQSWSFTGTGSQREFTLSNPAPNTTQANMFIVEVGGVLQHPVTNYTISSAGVLTFPVGDAPGNNETVRVRNFGIARSVNDTVSTAMLQALAVTADKVAPNAITTDKVASSGIAGTKVQGWYSFTPRYTLTWYPNDISGGASPVWMKKELPLASGVTDPYYIRYGRALTFGTSNATLTTVFWGRIALKVPTAPATSVIDATKIPGFYNGYPAQMRIDGLPPYRNSEGVVFTPYHVAWPSTWAGQDPYPNTGTMGVPPWLNGFYRNFQAETTSGYSQPPQFDVSHWNAVPCGGVVGGNPVSGGTNEANIVPFSNTLTMGFNVYDGTSGQGTTPFTGEGGGTIPDAVALTNWIPATALLGPQQAGQDRICDVMFAGVYGGG